jgi:hypothetical protein
MLIDRLTQQTVKNKDIPLPFNPSRYKARADLVIKGHSSFLAGSILAEDGSGRFKLEGQSFICGKAVDDGDQQLVELALLQIAEMVDFDNVKLPSPLLPSHLFDEEGNLNELELLLEGILNKGHLHEISRRPRFDMRYDELVLPVSRAKKLASSAERHLASHSECWQRRTLLGIQPRKIKGLVSEDEFNLYENCVYVRLLDRLERFLAKRIREIDALTKNLTDALDIEGSELMNYRLSRKLFSLWGGTFQTDTAAIDALDMLEATQETLRKEYKAIRGLIQHKFYRQIPKSAQIPGQIEQTNILSHDQHYRHLPKLWNTLRKQNHSENLTPQETLEKNVKLHQAYLSYCGLVIFRAFRQLGFEQFCSEAGSYELQREGNTITLTSDGSHWDIINNRSNKTIRLVPIFSWNPQKLYTHSGNGILTIPCCLKSGEAIGHPSNWLDGGSSSPMVMSPLNFYVEEQLVSLLSLWVLTHSARSYGGEIDRVPKSAMSLIQESEAFECLSSKSCRLVALPSEEELEGIKNALRRDNAMQSLSNLEKCLCLLRELSICPCCQSPGDFTSRDNLCFIVQCQSRDCQLEWGVSSKEGKRVFSMAVDEQGADFRVQGRWAAFLELA